MYRSWEPNGSQKGEMDMYKSELEKRLFDEKKMARDIAKIEDKTARYEALVGWIKTQHTEKCRWSVEAIADIANAYIDAKSYLDFCDDTLEEDKMWARGQVSVLEELLLENGWGWVVGLR